MASTIERIQTLVSRVITVKIILTAKDTGDSALISKFGDIMINPTGTFSDPAHVEYPSFYVNAGDPVPFFTVGQIQTTFQDDALSIAALQIKAKLWGDNISTQIQNSLIALRNPVINTDSTTMDSPINV